VGRPAGLWIARGLCFGAVALAFPVAAFAVFSLGADRDATADALAVVYAVGLFAGISTSLWPLPGLRAWSRFERVQSLVLVFAIVSYATHLSWELVWLLFHDAIIAARDSAWAYPWWAYIDGGDLRYAAATPTLLAMETLSVTNGLVGATGLLLWYRSGGADRSGAAGAGDQYHAVLKLHHGPPSWRRRLPGTCRRTGGRRPGPYR